MAKTKTTRRARENEASLMLETIDRLAMEGLENTDYGWNTIYDRGEAPATFSGGMTGARTSRVIPSLRDRDEGRFAPFYIEERDLDVMRGKCRNLATFTSVATGAMQATRVYTMGGEWEYKFEGKKDKGAEQPSKELLAELNVILQAILEKNRWVGDLDCEIHDTSREDGDTLVAGYAGNDGVADFKRRDADMVRQPARAADLNRWLELSDKRSSWTFGVHTVWDERMRHIDHEAHQGYHVVYDDGGREWDYLPAWPQQHAEESICGKFGHLIKRNTPRSAKRGVTDYYPIQSEVERLTKLSTNLGVGAAVLAAIPWFEIYPKGTNRDQVEASLTRGLNKFSRAVTANRGGETPVQHRKPGTVVHVSQGKEVTLGPLGQMRQPIYIEVAAFMLRQIGLRWLMPEYMISGDASNANFASTLVSESPFVKAREADQGFYVQHFRTILWKAIRMAYDAGRFDRLGVRAFGQIYALCELNIQPPMVASRDKTQQLAELQQLWEAGLLTGNEYRIDLRREPKPEYEGKTHQPQMLPGAITDGLAAMGGKPKPPGDDPNGQPAKPEPPKPDGGQGDKGGQPSGQKTDPKPEPPPKPKTERRVDRRAKIRREAFSRAIESATTLEEARAIAGRFRRRGVIEGERWITLNGGSGEGGDGGTPVKVDDSGAIKAGPPALAGKKLGETGGKKPAPKGKPPAKPAAKKPTPAAKPAKKEPAAKAPAAKPKQADADALGEADDALVEAESHYEQMLEDGSPAEIAKAEKAYNAAQAHFDKLNEGGKQAADVQASIDAKLKAHDAKAAQGVAQTDRGRTFVNKEAADAWGEQHHGEWASSLNESERNEVIAYTGSDYTEINGSLREGMDPATAKGGRARSVRLIDQAIAKAPPLDADTVLYRGMSVGSGIEFKPGMEFSDKGFVSTSMNNTVGSAFAEGDGALLKIKAPKGTRGAYVDLISLNKTENEFLLPRGSRFKVTRITKGKPGVAGAVIEVEVIQ